MASGRTDGSGSVLAGARAAGVVGAAGLVAALGLLPACGLARDEAPASEDVADVKGKREVSAAGRVDQDKRPSSPAATAAPMASAAAAPRPALAEAPEPADGEGKNDESAAAKEIAVPGAAPPSKARRSLDAEEQGVLGLGDRGPKGGRGASPPPPPADMPAPVVQKQEAAIDPNGRFATTYRPGGGHLAAFESAVARGLVPDAEREIVGDIGARYAPSLAKPTSAALAFGLDLERGKVAPSGGPVHVRIALQSTESKATERPPLSVHVVFDVSGSMRGELIQNARLAASAFVGKLGDADEFSLTTFSTDAQVRIPIGPVGPRRAEIKQSIETIEVQGGTNIGAGLTNGYAQAALTKNEDASKVVFLLSDGRANEGITQPAQLSRLALDAFQAGVQTSSFGLGTDYDGPLMSAIAQDGAGGYYYLRDSEQIAPALATELEKRLDPVATAVEVRVRFKPDVEVLKVYGSRRLGAEEAARVRTIEVASDVQAQKKDGIAMNRQDDKEGGMRFFMPAFARDDAHAILLKLRLPPGADVKDVAIVELKYKDRVAKKNVIDEVPLKVTYADSDAASFATLDPSMARTVQGFGAGETLAEAARLFAAGDKTRAAQLLAEREGLLHYAATSLGEPLFVRDAQRLSRLRQLAGGGTMNDPLVLAMLTETASNVHLR